MPSPLILHKGTRTALNCHKQDFKGQVLLATSCPYMRPPDTIDAGSAGDGVGMVLTEDDAGNPGWGGNSNGETVVVGGETYYFPCMLYQDWHMTIFANYSSKSDGLIVYAIDINGNETQLYKTFGLNNPDPAGADISGTFPDSSTVFDDKDYIVVPKCTVALRIDALHNFTDVSILDGALYANRGKPDPSVAGTEIESVILTFKPAP